MHRRYVPLLAALVSLSIGAAQCPGPGGQLHTPSPSSSAAPPTPTAPTTISFSEHLRTCVSGVLPPNSPEETTRTELITDQASLDQIAMSCLQWDGSTGIAALPGLDFSQHYLLLASAVWYGCGPTATFTSLAPVNQELSGEVVFYNECPECDCAWIPTDVLLFAVIERPALPLGSLSYRFQQNAP